MKAKANKDEILRLKGILILSGWKDFKAWSVHHGFKPNTVVKVIARHWKTFRKPCGMQTKYILNKLKEIEDEYRSGNRK